MLDNTRLVAKTGVATTCGTNEAGRGVSHSLKSLGEK
jgi:hypothetical protein